MKHWRESTITHALDEITAKLKGMTVFTTVDFKKVLDGGTSSRFQETYLHGPTLW